MSKINSPCKGCKNRYVGCHSDCIEYLDYKRKIEMVKEKNEGEVDIGIYKVKTIRRIKRVKEQYEKRR